MSGEAPSSKVNKDEGEREHFVTGLPLDDPFNSRPPSPELTHTYERQEQRSIVKPENDTLYRELFSQLQGPALSNLERPEGSGEQHAITFADPDAAPASLCESHHLAQSSSGPELPEGREAQFTAALVRTASSRRGLFGRPPDKPLPPLPSPSIRQQQVRQSRLPLSSSPQSQDGSPSDRSSIDSHHNDLSAQDQLSRFPQIDTWLQSVSADNGAEKQESLSQPRLVHEGKQASQTQKSSDRSLYAQEQVALPDNSEAPQAHSRPQPSHFPGHHSHPSQTLPLESSRREQHQHQAPISASSQLQQGGLRKSRLGSFKQNVRRLYDAPLESSTQNKQVQQSPSPSRSKQLEPLPHSPPPKGSEHQAPPPKIPQSGWSKLQTHVSHLSLAGNSKQSQGGPALRRAGSLRQARAHSPRLSSEAGALQLSGPSSSKQHEIVSGTSAAIDSGSHLSASHAPPTSGSTTRNQQPQPDHSQIPRSTSVANLRTYIPPSRRVHFTPSPQYTRVSGLPATPRGSPARREPSSYWSTEGQPSAEGLRITGILKHVAPPTASPALTPSRSVRIETRRSAYSSLPPLPPADRPEAELIPAALATRRVTSSHTSRAASIYQLPQGSSSLGAASLYAYRLLHPLYREIDDAATLYQSRPDGS